MSARQKAMVLGKQTIAEGVEDAGVLQALRELEVDYAQGRYLGAPEPVSQPELETRRGPLRLE